MRSVLVCAQLSALVFQVLAARPANAAWPSDPTINVPVTAATGAQRSPEAAPDGGGGAIVAWYDGRAIAHDIYVQRVDGTGMPRWTTNGVAICVASGDQYEPKVIADDSGGAIVTWSDFRGAAFDIYVQRVDSTGAPTWTTDGVGVCTAVGFQSYPVLVPDGSGGAIVAWDDDRTGTGVSRIYAQRVNASGVPQWTANGVQLASGGGGQARPIIATDGAGGAIVAWEDYRNGELDIFAQRILANGAKDPAWPVAGRAVALAAGEQETPVMAVDGNGGAFVAWSQSGNGLTRDVYVQHVLVSGAIDPAWPAGGRLMIPGMDPYDQASPAMVPDGSGGAIVCWDDLRGSSVDIYAHHVLASGALDPAWPSTGRALTLATGNQQLSRAVPDGAGGAVVTWQDTRADAGDIYAGHVLSTGTADPAWPDSGRAISTAGLLQFPPVIVADGAGGAVIAWEDRRSGAGPFGEDGDIYAQGVKANGQLGENPVAVPDESSFDLALESPRPNPTRAGAMVMRFTLPKAGAASLAVFDVAGRRLVTREVGSLGAGHHAVDVSAGWRPGAGVYFVRLVQGPSARVRSIVVLDE